MHVTYEPRGLQRWEQVMSNSQNTDLKSESRTRKVLQSFINSIVTEWILWLSHLIVALFGGDSVK